MRFRLRIGHRRLMRPGEEKHRSGIQTTLAQRLVAGKVRFSHWRQAPPGRIRATLADLDQAGKEVINARIPRYIEDVASGGAVHGYVQARAPAQTLSRSTSTVGMMVSLSGMPPLMRHTRICAIRDPSASEGCAIVVSGGVEVVEK